MRQRLFAIIEKLEKEETKNCVAIAALLRSVAEDGEKWEVEALVEIFKG